MEELLVKAIQGLRRRSRNMGDKDMAELCTKALEGDVHAFSEALIAIGESLVQNGSNTLLPGSDRIVDTAGGVWHPSEDACLLVGDDPEGLLAICHIAPTMGVWK